MDFIQLYEKLFGTIDRYVTNNLTTEEVFDLDSCPSWSDEVDSELLKELTEKYKMEVLT